LVVSWGWGSEDSRGSTLIDHHEWQGTRDPAAFLTVPDAIEYQRQNDWGRVRAECHQLARQARNRINELTHMAPLCPGTGDWFVQMFTVQLPVVDTAALQGALYARYGIEVVVHEWKELPLMRVSIQAYNREDDIERLLGALQELLG
jgi:isopenicillin-N epimerase